jgi:Deoxyribonuclease II
MERTAQYPRLRRSLQLAVACFSLIALAVFPQGAAAASSSAPVPLLKAAHPVDWWVVFKFNAQVFPGCPTGASRTCLFGGTVQPYKAFSQQFAYASSEHSALQSGADCLGDATSDPLGATFDQVYNGSFHYLIWNDQFYDDPKINGCTKECGAPWGHSKGMLAWDDAGDGLVLQVSTPSWPAAGSKKSPRTDGNTLGCVNDDDVEVSQHFFSVKLTKDDVVKVLNALQNASVVTDPKNPQIVSNGGPADIQKLVAGLGVQSKAATATIDRLSSGVHLISKPSHLHVPPWQMVSALLGGVPLRAATWWASPEIYSTTATTKMACWSPTLGKPGAVEIATTGHWEGKEFALTGGLGSNHNHAKIGVPTSGTSQYAIFGDMNQQGDALVATDCGSSQNGRGGLFYVVDDAGLFSSVKDLITGTTAPTAAPATAPAKAAGK